MIGVDIPKTYMDNPELLRGWMYVGQVANGKSDEAFLGTISLTRSDGSFHRDALPNWVITRLEQDGYIESNDGTWYRRT